MAFGRYFRVLAMMSAFLGIAATLAASAAPLDKEACVKLRAEKQSLMTSGVEKDMAKGPEWAKANLKPVQLDQVKRYIAVDEQIKFRCQTAIAEARAAAKAERIQAKTAKKGKNAAAAKAEDKAAQPAAKSNPVAGGEAKGPDNKDAKVEPQKAHTGDAPDDNEQE